MMTNQRLAEINGEMIKLLIAVKDSADAAIVCHQNALTFEMYEEPFYTPGWYLHGMPMRGISGERYIIRTRRKAE